MAGAPGLQRWLANVERRAVAPQAVAGIVRQHGITGASFRALESMSEIGDPDDKSYFLLPRGAGANQARDAALLTYLFNAGTGYGGAVPRPGGHPDFPETRYCAAETRRIIARQRANRWSYDAVRIISSTGGALVATPNGVLLGVAGNRLHNQFSQRGGTMWGDVFLLNSRIGGDPAEQLRRIIEAGRLGAGGPGLDRLLHHEEIHAQQWATRGISRMIRDYSWELFRETVLRRPNRLETAAGLRDGGYR